jgi:predicted CopG family antitoxin
VCSYRGISITQEDWNNPEIKTQRIREAFDSEMRNVFVVFIQAKETLRQYYENKPIERVLDVLDKIPNTKNKRMVTDLIANYIKERDENLYNTFMNMQKNRELSQEEENVMEMKREIKGNY